MRAIRAGAAMRRGSNASSSWRPSRAHHPHVGQIERRRFAGEVDEQPPLGQHAGAQLLEGAVGQDPAVADDDHPLGQRLDVVHVVGGEDDGDAALAVQPADELAHRQLGRRIEADGRLVEEEQRRLVQQRRGDLAAHALAERELAHRLVQQPARAAAAPTSSSRIARVAVLRHAVDVAQQVEALDHRQVPPQLGALAEHHADPRHVAAPAARQGTSPSTSQRAGRRLEDAGEDLDGGRLARAVGADQADQLARARAEADAGQRLDRAPAAVEQPLDRAQRARVALGDAIGLRQLLDEDLGHGWAPALAEGARNLVKRRHPVNERCYATLVRR